MKIFNKILTGALAALGFSSLPSCGMYATPPGAFVSMSVEVVDKDNDKPVCCADVSLKVLEGDKYRDRDTETTSPNGDTYIGESLPDVADRTYRIVVEDEEHGVYEKDSVDVKIYTTDFKGGNGKRDKGSAHKTLVFKLAKKTSNN